MAATPTRTPAATIVPTPAPVLVFPGGLALDKVNQRLFVSNYFGGTVAQVRNLVGTLTVVADAGGFSSPLGVAYDAVNQRLYVANLSAPALSQILNTVVRRP